MHWEKLCLVLRRPVLCVVQALPQALRMFSLFSWT